MLTYPTMGRPLGEDVVWLVERHGFFGWTDTSGGVGVPHTFEAAVEVLADFVRAEQEFRQRMRWPQHEFRIRNKVTGEIIPGDIMTP